MRVPRMKDTQVVIMMVPGMKDLDGVISRVPRKSAKTDQGNGTREDPADKNLWLLLLLMEGGKEGTWKEERKQEGGKERGRKERRGTSRRMNEY